ncbi:FtsW/RodA/SpoVE family cell cycle protein [Parvularcula sp. IMCC14364]|uniref:FtsW/RodA/SpoVE family cell cycle protein n=1 Tax=Parvularcula sp. IMCC14364 TaxID=3067902 RepID=UPI0027411AB2|nr:putative peptidoglycan glycosyltransferase FtsW [Parvularcula sp. IMCC14364]
MDSLYRRVFTLDESDFSVRRFVRDWWWSVDRSLIYCTGALILIGIVLCFAASPATAMRLGISNSYHFIERQLIFLGPSMVLLLGISILSPLYARRLGVLLFGGAVFFVLMALLFGPEINGAHRWLTFGSFSLQPSEFAKTGFVVTAAWLVAEGARDRSFHGGLIAMGCYGVLAMLLLLQPDYGQWLLITAVWAMMFFIAGWSWLWMAVLGCVAVSAASLGYLYAPHVSRRIDHFLRPETGDTYQVDTAVQALSSGGLLGNPDTEIKYQLPDAHTDFIFAVAGEEFGFFLCIVILAIYACFVFRAFQLAALKSSIFMQCAICGLAAQIGFQAIVNIGVSLRVLPAKGMTLPFISYGGSSLLATAITVGLILALTRKQSPALRRKEVMP